MPSVRRYGLALQCQFGAGETLAGSAPKGCDLPARLGRMGVANMEMETSTLFTLATLAGVRAGAVCAIFANRPRGTFIEPDAMYGVEDY